MEITQTVLVAIMFVMILSIGIATIITGSARLVNQRSNFNRM